MEQNKWKELFMKYKIQIGVAAVILLVAAAAVLSGGNGTASGQEDVTAEETQEPAEETVEESNELEENSHASIERLILKYCEYMASGDVDALSEIVDVLTDEDKESIQSRSAFIEAYENVVCYTKNGQEEDSYIVFVCYDMKLINIETSAPDIICLYVGPKDEDGDRLIHYGDIDESMQAYVAELEKDPEVQALYDDVRTRYQQAQEQDPALAEFIQRISGQVSSETEETGEETPEETGEAETGEEPAETGEAETGEEPAEIGEAETGEEPESTGEGTAVNRETRVTESVNLRAEASTDAERLALIYEGETVTQITAYDNGWSQVEYNGMTGYLMTEYLEGSTESSDAGSDSQASASAGSSRETRVTESVNLRAEASSDAERLALIYQGETVTELQAYDNGWSQVEYNGTTGYLMSEYLE